MRLNQSASRNISLPAWENGKNIVISTVENNNIEPQAASENLNFFFNY